VVYPPTGSTAYEKEMSTPPTLLRSMALLYPDTAAEPSNADTLLKAQPLTACVVCSIT